MRRFGVAVLCLCILTVGARAQWFYQEDESAFGDPSMRLMVTSDGLYGFAVRCTDRIEAVFITPDTSFTAESMEMANYALPQLLVRIDRNPSIELAAQLVDQEGKATVLAEASPDLIAQIENAKSRVAVAVKLLGDVYHERKFGVVGSTAKARKLQEACPAASTNAENPSG